MFWTLVYLFLGALLWHITHGALDFYSLLMYGEILFWPFVIAWIVFIYIGLPILLISAAVLFVGWLVSRK